MNRFIRKYSEELQSVLSGFDRIILKGTLRPLSYVAGMMSFLFHREVLLKGFKTYVLEVSKALKEASQAEATSRSAWSCPTCRDRRSCSRRHQSLQENGA